MSADALDKTCCTRVYNNCLHLFPCTQMFQLSIMLLIGPTDSFFSGIVIVFIQATPYSISLAPQPHRTWIDRSIIAGNQKSSALRTTVQHVPCFGKHRINKPLRLYPFAQHEALIKVSAVKIFVSSAHPDGKRRIILHPKMKITQIFFLSSADPIRIKPVPRMFRITVKPELASFYRTSGYRLFHKIPVLQRNLIEKYTCQSHSLNGRRTRTVFSRK